MAVHRYWRAGMFASRGSDNFYSIYEWHLATAVGGANVASTGAMTYSGTLWSGAASSLNDGNSATGLILDGRTNASCYLICDFGAGNEKDIVETGFMCRPDGFVYQAPCVGDLEYSDDGINWTKSFGWTVPEWTYLSELRKFTAAPIGVAFDWYPYKTLSVKLTTAARLLATFTAVSTVAVNVPNGELSYAEFTITTLTGTPAVGMVNSFYNYAVGTLLGADANSLGYRSGGNVVANNVTLAALAAYVQGDRIGIAYDSKKRLIWFRVNGGNWNNNAANDPVTGVGGIDTSSVTWGTARMACGASITGTVITGAFSAFTDTVPTGYAAPGPVTRGSSGTRPSGGILAPTFPPGGKAMPAPRSNRMFSPAGTITKVSGTTKENGIIIPGKKVEVYDRDDGHLIDSVVSDALGHWEAVALGRPAVRVVGSDPTTYNSIVYDNVVPL